MLLLAFGNRIGPIHDGRAPALSVAGTGFKGLVTLVGRFRETARDRRAGRISRPTTWSSSRSIRATAPEDVARLLDLRRGKATLIILPKWLTMPDPNHRAWVRALGPGAGIPLAPQIVDKAQVRVSPQAVSPDRFASGQDFLEGVQVPVPGYAQTIGGGDLRPLLTLPNGDALLARIGDQPHYVAADPDLFNNHGLRDPAQARAALALIDALNSQPAGRSRSTSPSTASPTIARRACCAPCSSRPSWR